jgi:hypothetical protein
VTPRPTALAAALLICGAALAADGQPSAHDAATAREALRGALGLRDVPLRLHPSCAAAGADAADRTVGDYLAGQLAAMDRPANTVSAACTAAPAGRRACSVWFKHRSDEERWAWGLAFELDARGRPLARSIRCLGAG